uniref:FAR1 DNA-binding domain n=3 Tax=Schistocephalus solidus TaxID=70667 RepID=A0A0X3NHJ7_SCHSO
MNSWRILVARRSLHLMSSTKCYRSSSRQVQSTHVTLPSTHLQTTGTRYLMKRSCLFNEGSLGREFLVYRYMHFMCVRHPNPARMRWQRVGGTKCPAYFSVGTKRHKLIVRHYDMQHNHGACMALPTEDTPPLEPPMVDENLKDVLDLSAMNQMTVKDCTEEFLKIFQSTSFDTFNELQAKMDEFQMVTGNRYVKTNTRRLPPDSPNAETLVYSHLVYICYRYGTNVTLYKSRKPQRTAKIGCRSKIYFYVHDNRLHVRRYDFRHNHEVGPDLVQFPPKRRRSKKQMQQLAQQQQQQQLELQCQQQPQLQQHYQQHSHLSSMRPLMGMAEDDEDEEEDSVEGDDEEEDETSLPLLSMMFQQPGCASRMQLESDFRSMFSPYETNESKPPPPPPPFVSESHGFLNSCNSVASHPPTMDFPFSPDPSWAIMRPRRHRALDSVFFPPVTPLPASQRVGDLFWLH